jgi:hypothetical protein
VVLSDAVTGVLSGTVEGWVDNALYAIVGNLNQWNHVMYALPSVVDFQGAEGWAYMGGIKSAYRGDSVSYMGVQMHELGHNIRMHHSGSAGGSPYGDFTGLMGTFDFPPKIISA